MRQRKQSHPISWAKIEVIFERNPSNPNDAPRIMKFAPGRPPRLVNCSQEAQSKSTSYGGEAGGEEAGTKVVATYKREKARDKERGYSGRIQAHGERSSAKLEGPNTVVWILEGNPSQRTAVPPIIDLGVVLTRDDGPFQCKVRVDVEVDWFHTPWAKTKDWFTQFKRWSKTVPSPVMFNPETKNMIVPDKLDPKHLEKLEKDNLLESMIRVQMPQNCTHSDNQIA